MKTFKEFQTESYSRLDEGLGKAAGFVKDQLLKRAGGGFTGNVIYNTVAPDVGKVLPGKDGKKVKSTKGNWKGATASAIASGLGDKLVKPTYSLAKWGVTKGIPGAVTTAGKIITAVGAMNKMH